MHKHVLSGRQNNLHNPSEPWLTIIPFCLIVRRWDQCAVYILYSKISTDPGLLKIPHSHRFVAVVIQILILSVSKRARAPLRIHSSQRHTFTYHMEELTGTLLYKYVEVVSYYKLTRKGERDLSQMD